VEVLIQLWILSTGLGILLSAAAGGIWQQKGGSFWTGLALSIVLGMIGFALVVLRNPRRSPEEPRSD
jgi:hypothetical protein